MEHQRLDIDWALGSPPLPPPWPHDLLPEIGKAVGAQGRKLVVLDDDPTGTQTVHGVAVLTDWSRETLRTEMARDGHAFYILTNSRSLPVQKACQLNQEIGGNLTWAADQAQCSFDVISRSDSTLRGHFPEEVDALANALDRGAWPCIVMPCFFEGGRYTLEDIHYVAEGNRLIPAAQTSYAKDASFGFHHSNLRHWVEEKTMGRIRHDHVDAIALNDIRMGGPAAVSARLMDLTSGAICIVNAAGYRDVEVFVAGLMDAQAQGRRFMFRTAASFVRVRAAITPQALLEEDMLVTDTPYGGVFVVGSHVPKTSDQLAALAGQDGVAMLLVDVGKLLAANQRLEEIDRVGAALNDAIQRYEAVVVHTSRELVTGGDAEGSLGIGQRISDGLIAILALLKHQPRYLVAKGGITSSDVAVHGLGVRRAMILGQILPGVPVWRLGPESRYPGMAYIVFPGNVGAVDALIDIKNRLTAAGTPGP